jgi:hypothetical protein
MLYGKRQATAWGRGQAFAPSTIDEKTVNSSAEPAPTLPYSKKKPQVIRLGL